MHDSTAGLQVYYIWYGGWGNLKNNGTTQRPSTVKVLTDLAQSVGGQPWFNMMTTYSDSSGAVVNKIKYGGKTGITAGTKCWQVRVFALSSSASLHKATMTQPGAGQEGRTHSNLFAYTDSSACRQQDHVRRAHRHHRRHQMLAGSACGQALRQLCAAESLLAEKLWSGVTNLQYVDPACSRHVQRLLGSLTLRALCQTQ